MLSVSQSRGLKLFGREIIFGEFQPMCCWYLNVTDGQTDGRLTIALPRSALASRGKNVNIHTSVSDAAMSCVACGTFSRYHALFGLYIVLILGLFFVSFSFLFVDTFAFLLMLLFSFSFSLPGNGKTLKLSQITVGETKFTAVLLAQEKRRGQNSNVKTMKSTYSTYWKYIKPGRNIQVTGTSRRNTIHSFE